MRKALLILLLVSSAAFAQRAGMYGNGSKTKISGSTPAAFVGTAYSQHYVYGSGSISTTYTISSGTPTQDGLTLNVGASASITGTPTTVACPSWVLKAVPIRGPTAFRTLTVCVQQLVAASSISISTTLSVAVNATSGAQTATVTYTDGSTSTSAPVKWSISGTASINSVTGAVTGLSPTGSASVTASIPGAGGLTVTSNVENVTVTGGTPPANPSIVTNSPLPTGYSSVAYVGTSIVATGGTGGIASYAITAGSLTGSGLSFNTSTGAITGTGSAAGTYSITVTATDGSAQTSNPATFQIPILAVSSPVQITLAGGATATTLANSGTAQIVSTKCYYSGGTLGPCPSTLAYASSATGVATVGSSTGLISAASSGTGSANITATVTGCASCTSNAIAVTVASALSISTASLPNGQTTPIGGLPYPESGSPAQSNQLVASGGTGPYTWSINSGSLPTGLSLSSGGLITGTLASGASTQTVNFKVTDSLAATATKNLTITVATLTATIVTCPIVGCSTAQNAQVQMSLSGNFSDGTNASLAGLSGSTVVMASSLSGAANNSTNVATLTTPTFTANLGDVIHVHYHSDGSGVTPTFAVPTDTLSNTALAASVKQCVGVASDRCDQDFYFVIGTGGTDEITCHLGTATHPVSCLPERMTGLSGTPLDQTANSNDGGNYGNQCTSGAITPSFAGSIAILTCSPNNGGRVFTKSSACQAPNVDSIGFTGISPCAGLTTSPTTEQETFDGSAQQWNASIVNYLAAASGIVWTASDLAGTNVASMANQIGLVNSNNPGTSTIKACISTTCGSLILSVQGLADTSITVTPASTSTTPGGTVTFQAIGNPNEDNLTSVVTWGVSPSSYGSITQGTGQFTAGLTTSVNAAITATFGGVGGIGCNSQGGTCGTVSINALSSQSLIPGCTVNSSNIPSCAPAGWSLVVAEGFDAANGQLGNTNESTVGSLGFTTQQAHTGSHSLGSLINCDQCTTEWNWNTGIGSFTDAYLSYWQWIDSGALFNDEFILGDIQNQAGGTFNQENVFDLYGYSFNTATPSIALIGNGAADWAQVLGGLGLSPGGWHQLEMWWHPSTGNTSNGFMILYFDGQQKAILQNYNLNGSVTMSGNITTIYAGGPYTKLLWTANGDGTGACTALGTGGGIDLNGGGVSFSTLGAKCPPTAPTFNRYIDDVVLFKK